MTRTEEKLREALRGLMESKFLDLGDMVYQVREREGLGWDGPAVVAWSKAVQDAKQALSLPTAADPIREAEVTEALEFVMLYRGPAEKHLAVLARELRAEWALARLAALKGE